MKKKPLKSSLKISSKTVATVLWASPSPFLVLEEIKKVEGTRRVLAAAAQAGANRLVLASSCAVYGDEPTMPKLS